MVVVFCPFAAGYFISFFFRNVNAVISRDLAGEFALSPSELGLLTSLYLLAFAAFQLPLGVLLDRYGPRRVLAALFCVAGAGALVFGFAQDFTMLSVGRALIGLGVSGGLMGAIKAFSLFFPLSRLATLNGLYLAIGGLGGLAATAPAEALVGPFGWRVLFYLLAGLSVAVAALIYFVVPEKKLPGEGESLGAQIAGFGHIFASVPFWRIVAPMVVCMSIFQALQGLWLAPWLYDVAGADRQGAANFLFATALAFALGSVFFGAGSDRMARSGLPRLLLFKLGIAVSLAAFGMVAWGVRDGLWVVLALWGFAAMASSLGYALLTPLFPPAMTGRANSASNVLMFACSFAFQWGVGAVLKGYPAADGRYAPEGYALAFGILAALQLATLAWLAPMREPKPAAP